jgi:integrase
MRKCRSSGPVDRRGTFGDVIQAYLTSHKFSALGASTRQGYRQYLTLAQLPQFLGDVPVDEIRPSLVQRFLDCLADRPGAQQRAWVALSAVQRWAIVRDLLPRPITIGTEIVGGGEGHEPWTDAQVALAEAHCRPAVARAITLASNTGQRGSDLVRMTWADLEAIDGRRGVNVRQVKTGLVLWIPCTEALDAALDAWGPPRPAPLLLAPGGAPWPSRKALHEAWLRDRDTIPELAPCAGLTLHGLRATAIIRLRRHGWVVGADDRPVLPARRPACQRNGGGASPRRPAAVD